jgi:hypothetical protein
MAYPTRPRCEHAKRGRLLPMDIRAFWASSSAGLDRVVYRCHCDGDLIGLSSRLFRKVSLSLTTCPKVSICASVSEYLSHVDCEEVAIEGVHVRA